MSKKIEENYNIDQLIDYVCQAAKEANANENHDTMIRLMMQVYYYKMGQQNIIPDEWKKYVPPLS